MDTMPQLTAKQSEAVDLRPYRNGSDIPATAEKSDAVKAWLRCCKLRRSGSKLSDSAREVKMEIPVKPTSIPLHLGG